MPPDKPLRAAGEFESDFTEDLHKNPHQIGLEDGNHVSSQPEPFDSGDMWVLTYQPAVLLAIKQFFAGAVAGACAKTAIAPLDRAKILFQVSQEPFSYRSLVRQLRSTVRNEGFIALYKGNLATVSRVLPYSGIQLMAFDQYSRMIRSGREGLAAQRLSSTEKFFVGAMAGATSVLLTYPLDLMRARLAVQRAHMKYAGLGDAFSVALREEGLHALFRGAIPTLLGILPYAGLSFYTFETTKQALREFTGKEPTHLQKLLCGGVAGFVGQSATYPLDIARRRMQTETFIINNLVAKGWSSTDPLSGPIEKPKQGVGLVEHSGDNFLRIWQRVIQREGVRGLFKGLSMNWIKGPTSVGISFTVFDIMKTALGAQS